MDPQPVPYVTLRDLVDLHLELRKTADSDVAATSTDDKRTQFAGTRAAWSQTHGGIVQEFFGTELAVVALLTADGRLHLEYSPGQVAAIEPQFAETLTRIEFIASRADVFLEPMRGTRNADSTPGGYYADTRGLAVIGVQLFATARYVLDFLEYAYTKDLREIDPLRRSVEDLRQQYGFDDEETDRSTAAVDIGPPDVERERAAANYADRRKRIVAEETALRELVAAAVTLVGARLADAETSVNRQARTSYTRRYVVGVAIGLTTMSAISVGVGLLSLARSHADHLDLLALAVALGAGAIGATISVLTRLVNADLLIDPGASSSEVRTAGMSRAFIGSVFGGVVFAFGATGLVSLPKGSGTGSSTILWAAFGFLAGFSERWVQDLLGTVESTSGGESSQPRPHPSRKNDCQKRRETSATTLLR